MPSTTTYSITGNPYIDGVLGGSRWATLDLTYSFPALASYYGTGYGYDEPLYNFAQLSLAQQSAARATFSLISGVTQMDFVELDETSTTHADLRLASSDRPSTAWAYLPISLAEGGDAWFNRSSGYYSSPFKGNYGFATFIHEIGHALGLEHAHEHYVMPSDRDSMEYTIMSYRSYVGAPLTGYTNEYWGFAQSLMMYDIAALQHMYGADFSTNAGNTTYRWNPSTGEMAINGAGQGAPGANRIFMTVWDGGGSDTYDFSNYSAALKVDLRPGEWTTTSVAQLAWLHYDGSKIAKGNIANALQHNGDIRSLIENARGGSANDSMIGNNAANTLYGNGGHDKLYGGNGNDRLVGGSGSDYLHGGAGIDTAYYSSAAATNASKGIGLIADLLSASLNTGEAAGDRFAYIESLVGSKFSDSLRGDNYSNGLSGLAGNDTLYGRAGNDKLYGSDGNDSLVGGTGADRLDGGAGSDRAYYSSAAATDSTKGTGLLVDLSYAHLNTGEAVGDTYFGIEGLVGSKYNDSLRGDGAANLIYGQAGRDSLYGRSGNDQIYGGDGNDALIGGAGGDVLYGQAGSDRFVFSSSTESAVLSCDTIGDFARGYDRIDLRKIDANSRIAADQAFAFIGTKALTGKAGDLNCKSGVVAGDVNGDGVADFQIKLLNISSLSAGDFYV